MSWGGGGGNSKKYVLLDAAESDGLSGVFYFRGYNMSNTIRC